MGHAAKIGIALDAVNVTAPADMEAVFAQLPQKPTKAVFMLTDNSLFGLAEPIIARALAARVPVFGNFSEPFAVAGGLFAYSRDPKEAFQGVARLLKRLLDGASPHDLPFEQPTKFNLFVNLEDGEDARYRRARAVHRDRGPRDRMGSTPTALILRSREAASPRMAAARRRQADMVRDGACAPPHHEGVTERARDKFDTTSKSLLIFRNHVNPLEQKYSVCHVGQISDLSRILAHTRGVSRSSRCVGPGM